jgi:hypothetical protein
MGVFSGRLVQASRREADGESGQAALSRGEALGWPGRRMFEELALFVAVGFAAQLIDGAIGMAYGLFASSVLLGFGVPPATASASVHVAEVFTTGASGSRTGAWATCAGTWCCAWPCPAPWAGSWAPMR